MQLGLAGHADDSDSHLPRIPIAVGIRLLSDMQKPTAVNGEQMIHATLKEAIVEGRLVTLTFSAQMTGSHDRRVDDDNLAIVRGVRQLHAPSLPGCDADEESGDRGDGSDDEPERAPS